MIRQNLTRLFFSTTAGPSTRESHASFTSRRPRRAAPVTRRRGHRVRHALRQREQAGRSRSAPDHPREPRYRGVSSSSRVATRPATSVARSWTSTSTSTCQGTSAPATASSMTRTSSACTAARPHRARTTGASRPSRASSAARIRPGPARASGSHRSRSSRNGAPAKAGMIEPTTASGLRARRRSRHVSGKSPT